MTDRLDNGLRCTLYLHIDNARRCLVVSEGAVFPSHLDHACWRLIAPGLPVSVDAEWALKKHGFYQYVTPAK